MHHTYQLTTEPPGNPSFEHIKGVHHHEGLTLTLDGEPSQALLKALDEHRIGLIKEEDDDHHHDHHSHNHDHSHGHHHHGGDSENPNKNMFIVFTINIIFSTLEFIFGYKLSSSIIFTDAVHDAGDALSIGFAWILQDISTVEGNEKYPSSLRRFSLLGALITGVTLAVGSSFMLYFNLTGLDGPQHVHASGSMMMALIAISVKLITMYIMNKGSSQNEKMLTLHMMEDLLGWIAAFVMNFIIYVTKFALLDRIFASLIALFILYRSIPLLIETVQLLLNKTPKGIDIGEIKHELFHVHQQIKDIVYLDITSFDGAKHQAVVQIDLFGAFNPEETLELKQGIREALYHHGVILSTIALETERA